MPFVRVKLAMSLDGRTAMESGESQWITGPAARSAVQRLRAQASVVLTGADTVLADNARLTVRADELGLDPEQTALAMSRPPLRVLIDGRLRVPLDAPFFKAGPALVATCMAIEEQYANGPECLIVPGDDGQVDLRQTAGRTRRTVGSTKCWSKPDRVWPGLLPSKGWWTSSRFSSPASF